ncbi:MAG: 50S ribosomal protein L11 methyltransferase [Anaerolineae bacterium]|nr:50S ribosomal protein L11 methyltransferase [Anaerolineae bacterium]
MQWVEVTLSVDGEAAEAVAELLQRYSYQGVAIEQENVPQEAWDDGHAEPPQRLTIRAYFPADRRVEETKLLLDTALGHMSMMYPMPVPSYRTIDEADWAEAWKVNYRPIRLGRKLLIRPEWVEMETAPDDIVISLDPGMAFGTGTHPTTQLCLEALEDLVKPGAQVLDLGCGSGILTIAAAKLGAAHILAVDTDPIAVTATQQNVARSGVADHITVQQGSLENVVNSGQRFDLVAANILARVIILMCDEDLGQVIQPGGVGIFSGIIAEQAADVEAALRHTGLKPFARRPQGDWVAILAKRPLPQSADA